MPGLDRTYPGLRVHHLDPLVLVADGFLSDDECDAYRALAGGESAQLSQSATFSSLTASGRIDDVVRHTRRRTRCWRGRPR